MIANDVRFRIKNKINYISNCSLKEQKGYKVMRILFDVRNVGASLDSLVHPIKYYSFLYDQIVILTDKKDFFEECFSYDPTVIITDEPLDTVLTYKKSFLLKDRDLSKESLHQELEITEEIMKKYFSNF
jgi:hypothetical protein